MAFLEVRLPQGSRRIRLDRSITIGRHPDNALVLPDDRASRHHCVIEPDDGGYVLRDLDSRNGTKVNATRVNTEPLRNGDVVCIGAVEMHFIDPEEAAAPKRSDTPDFSRTKSEPDPFLAAATLDLDEMVGEASTGYERRLREIIDASPEKPFDESHISLVDARGVTVHQATASGVEKGSGGEGGEGIRIFRLLLLACFRARATDLHVEPRMEGAAVRLRVDGYMLPAVEFSAAILKRILGVVKILCELDTSRRNVVQDGHFSAIVKGRRVDYRVSLTPTMHGQKLVVRVLDTANAPSRLHELGLVPWMYEKLRAIATKDAGFLLACGPTGSGKTTSLYSCLREIDVEQRNAITIEDPVEYSLDGCTQIPIDAKQESTFANILRSVLRQDPDVIFVGEIRDIETATVAMQAAMTGHLVYSTVHAKDSIGAVFRLLDLGVEPYLVANAISVILAQRLVRTLCDHCKQKKQPTPQQNMQMGRAVDGVPEIYVPTGCRRCLRTGFTGRRALFELLEANDAMRDVILRSPSIQGMREIADQGLFTTLRQYGFQLVAQGVTSFDEIERVSGSD